MNFETLKKMRWVGARRYLKKHHQICDTYRYKLNKARSLRDFIACLTSDQRSTAALWWGEHFPKDRVLVRPLITRSSDAYHWTRNFPEDRELMRSLVTESRYAYHWTRNFPEDRGLMRPLIKNSRYAYYWTFDFPEDKEIMRPFITESRDACLWATQFPEDREVMRPLITRSEDAWWWAKKFPEDKEYFETKLGPLLYTLVSYRSEVFDSEVPTFSIMVDFSPLTSISNGTIT